MAAWTTGFAGGKFNIKRTNINNPRRNSYQHQQSNFKIAQLNFFVNKPRLLYIFFETSINSLPVFFTREFACVCVKKREAPDTQPYDVLPLNI